MAGVEHPEPIAWETEYMRADEPQMKTRQNRAWLRDRYLHMRRNGVSQSDARELTGIPRTTAWRYDRAAFGNDLPPVKAKPKRSDGPRALGADL